MSSRHRRRPLCRLRHCRIIIGSRLALLSLRASDADPGILASRGLPVRSCPGSPRARGPPFPTADHATPVPPRPRFVPRRPTMCHRPVVHSPARRIRAAARPRRRHRGAVARDPVRTAGRRGAARLRRASARSGSRSSSTTTRRSSRSGACTSRTCSWCRRRAGEGSAAAAGGAGAAGPRARLRSPRVGRARLEQTGDWLLPADGRGADGLAGLPPDRRGARGRRCSK